MSNWMDCTVERCEDHTPTSRRFWLRHPEGQPWPPQKPGQFLTLELPIAERRAQRLRSYSIASPPQLGQEEGLMELLIALNPNGLGTPYLFEQCPAGAVIKAQGPIGVFTLSDEEAMEREICFICTGTGITPFRAMLLDFHHRGVPIKKATLLMGTRTEKDLLYHDEFTQLSESWAPFTYLPTLSRSVEGDGWTGERGYVHDIYKRLFADRRDGLFYLCGWRAMIDEARANLTEMGYAFKKDVRLELYG
jgi:CDP-4-dehydro-6-deoxyglucose reductase